MRSSVAAISVSSLRTENGQSPVRELVAKYGQRLFGLAKRLCPNPSDAEDLVQETFLQAHRKFAGFRGDSDPGTWLYTIATRLCRRKFSRPGGVPVPRLADLLPFHDVGVIVARAQEQSPLAEQIDRETIDALEAAIAALPGTFRFPLVLKDIAQLPIADVAIALEIKPQTVKSRVHRARLMLRRVLLSRMPLRPAPAPSYERQVCLDLLAAKLGAMDRGKDIQLGLKVLCERCLAVFRELDLTQAACADLADGHIPESLRRMILGRLDATCGANRTPSGETRTGRRWARMGASS